VSEILWTPLAKNASRTNIALLQRAIEEHFEVSFKDYAAFHTWTVDHVTDFWAFIWEACDVVGMRGEEILSFPNLMPGARWFPDTQINYAENVLHSRPDDTEVMVFRAEDGSGRRLSYSDLCSQVSRVAAALSANGIRKGDRVAAYLPNIPETVIIMLGAASLGAVFSSASPDFGVKGLLDRFGQIQPKILFATDGYYYNGKSHDCLPKVLEVRKHLPGLQKVVIVPFLGENHRGETSVDETWESFLADYSPRPIYFEPLPFDHPLYILFSSGTTGAPKCIVHGHGGTLLQHLKEHRYHCDIKAKDRIFYYTTCGWMMWNWLVSVLASDAAIFLYDGSPFHPSADVLFDYVEHEKITLFGTSAKFIDAIRKAQLKPIRTHRLKALRTITSTGSPLVPESFDFSYDSIKADVQLASISGGTDIISCFVSGNAALPVRRGEIQCKALGMDVAVLDKDGKRVIGEAGDLVCCNPFPSMPVEFLNDIDGSKYRAAYFDSFPGVWTHGDWVEETRDGGFIIYGRSDATLNPGGVRIGTAEIYRQVEGFPEVIEALSVGQDWQGDVRIVLFLVLRNGVSLNQGLADKIKKQIRNNCTVHHVPSIIIQVTDIPRTKSGKITELTVRDVIHGRVVRNVDALANPDALDQYRDLIQLQS